MIEQIDQNNKFKLWTKWFWIGIIAAAYHVIVGLVYGIALALEKDRRKEGIIIVFFAIGWYLFSFYWFVPWLGAHLKY